jgi:hypothetical protein
LFLRPLPLFAAKKFMSTAYQIVVCGSIVPDPLRTLEPVASPIGPALKNEMMLPAVLDLWVSNVAKNAASNLRIPTGFHHSAQGCEERATLGSRPNKTSTATRLHRPPAKPMQPVPGCIQFDSSTQRRPIPSSNAGLNDEIPLGFSEHRSRPT